MAKQRDDTGEADTARIPLLGETALVRPYVQQAVVEPTEEIDSSPEPGTPGSAGSRPPVARPARPQPSDRGRRAVAVVVGSSTAVRRDHRRRTALLVGVGGLLLAGLGLAVAGAAHLLPGGADGPAGQSAPMVDATLASADAAGGPAHPATPSHGAGGPALDSASARPSATGRTSVAPSASSSDSSDSSTPASGPVAPAGRTGTAAPAPGTAGDPDLALHASARDDGHTQTYTAANAVDGDPDSYWESTDNAFPQSLTVDLGAKHTVGRLQLRLPPLAAWGARTQTLAVLGSGDGTSFATLSGPAGYTFDPRGGNAVTVLLPAHSPVRYLRLTFTGNTGWPAGQLSDLQAYAS
ncbi:discoidin domain-containing protein [Streptacidiphilus sp. N1-12]|uniref:Discoidin domain-containing protein n=2 Tax=Streptacidiphilus alkalitolerans TaxID=3342712 RepID=A0ABV6VN40_9ACTN